MQSGIATTVQKAKVNDTYLLARAGGGGGHNQLSSMNFMFFLVGVVLNPGGAG